MTDFTPSPEAVEAVAKALVKHGQIYQARVEAEEAIAAFVEAEGLKLEQPGIGMVDRNWQRLVGPWRKRDD